MSRPVTCLLAFCILMAMVLVPASAYPYTFDAKYYRDLNSYDPEEIIDMLNRLRNVIRNERIIASEKRSLDFGLGRGYTGELQAKHLMGQAAANDAGGPGRRRRDTHLMQQ